MSRSIGDMLAHSIGVIPDPGKITPSQHIDVFIYKMNRNDFKYTVVSASDGLWDMLNNSEVQQYIEMNRKAYSDLHQFCRDFVKHTRLQWTEVGYFNS
jgi:serine/threonine protein phosphatase PrpC